MKRLSLRLFRTAAPVAASLFLAAPLVSPAGEKAAADSTSRIVSTKEFSKPTDEELRKRLTPLQYQVTRENGTERPFTNEFWRHKEEGIYVDITTGKPLFSSKDKFDTDCGWPGFARPIEAGEIKELVDKSHGMTRVEVRSKTGDAHLGHVFDDGPKELGGLRYCINSAALRFIPRTKMAEAGYGDWLKIFEPAKDSGQAPAAK